MLTLGLLLVAAGLCFLYVQQSTALRSLTAQCEDTRQALAEAREINAALAYEIDRTFSLQRIADFARNRLGMIEPTTIRYVQRTHAPGS